MNEHSKRPPPPEDFDENPELTDEFFENAETGPPDWWTPSFAIRQSAMVLRAQADRLDRSADEMDARESRKTGTAAE